MDSTELYHLRQQFILGAYEAVAATPLPDPNSTDYTSFLVYQARAHIALNNPSKAITISSTFSDNVSLKAVSSLARYTASKNAVEKDTTLEELRDLVVEIEGDDVEGTERDKFMVRVLAGTAFALAGELEEALDTLGTETQDLEAVAVIVHIYLSINRPDLAKKQFERSKNWAEDDLLLQLIESNIGLVTGRDAYSNTASFYTEQIGNPSLNSPHLLTARGVTRILRNEFVEAVSDLEESLQQNENNAEAIAAYIVASTLAGTKNTKADDYWITLRQKYPEHPLVLDVDTKAASFDEALAKFIVPPPISIA